MRDRSSTRPSAARRLASRVKRAVLSRRVVTVRSGPATGLRIGLHLASADYGAGENELPVQTALADNLHPGQTMYDIGSNVGFFALLAARVVGPSGSVHAFEAVPDCARALERNVSRNHFGQVTVHAVAVSDHPGSVDVYQGRHPGGATISARDRPADLRSTRQIRSVTIDELVASGSMAPPDLVKVDVEGAEAEVLRGMTQTLEAHRPIIVCELDDRSREGLETKRSEIAGLLAPIGYSFTELEPSYPGSRSLVVHLLCRPE